MFAGLLKISGTIDPKQFWPDGEADADTTKIKLEVGPTSFQFRPHAAAPFQATQAYVGAKSRGKTTKAVIDTNGRVTIRLQGIDAPELHYRPTKPSTLTKPQGEKFKAANAEFRQRLSETATLALATFLAPAVNSAGLIDCEAHTSVDRPGDAVDTYGRIVADILVTVGGQRVDINQWLVENSWAYPTFYNSMSREEITAFLALTQKARAVKLKGRLWAHYSKQIDAFEHDLRYRRHGPADPAGDRGPVIMPKVYRRLSVWAVGRKAKVIAGKFNTYLAGIDDKCYETDDFLQQTHAAQIQTLADFVTAQGKLSVLPQELVFREAPGKLVGPDGKTITTW
jgi:endonuclease YncB( thermonuclease family)